MIQIHCYNCKLLLTGYELLNEQTWFCDYTKKTYRMCYKCLKALADKELMGVTLREHLDVKNSIEKGEQYD